MNREITVTLSGQGIVNRIDESMFYYKQKYHNGSMSQCNRWVFGIADILNSPAKYYVQVVNNRRAATLLPIIESICRLGTIIWSDKWSAYINISNHYDHGTVNHTFNFVNPITGTHTQHIESSWNELKRRLKGIMGVGNGDLNPYLKVWMWLDNEAGNDFENLLNILR